MANFINRRKFVTGTALSAAGILMSDRVLGIHDANAASYTSVKENVKLKYNLMNDVMKYRKLDSHVHAYLFDGGPEGNIAFADRLGIDKMFISLPAYRGEGTPQEFRCRIKSIYPIKDQRSSILSNYRKND
jgi:hypothetical protein